MAGAQHLVDHRAAVTGIDQMQPADALAQPDIADVTAAERAVAVVDQPGLVRRRRRGTLLAAVRRLHDPGFHKKNP